MDAPAISCEGLTKRFGKLAAVDGITLEVPAGAAFGFLGPNGAGKTTMIRALLGLLRPTSGTARVFGHDTWSDAVAVHRIAGSLPGDFQFDPALTGRQLVRHVGRLRGSSASDLAYAEHLAERLHASLDRPMGDLSRGNHQKLGLIQAMFHRPKLLLLDEPTSGLDPLMQELFVELVHEARADGATIFLSSHNLTEVEHICERVAIIREGRLVTTDDVAHLAEQALRHVQVSFGGDVPEAAIAALPGVTDLSVRGHQATFRLAGGLDGLVGLLAGHTVADLTVQRANLEELFRSFYEGAADA